MNTLTHSHHFTTASQRSLQACLGWCRSVLDGMRRAHRQRAMLRALDALDERTLYDIGVHRPNSIRWSPNCGALRRPSAGGSCN